MKSILENEEFITNLNNFISRVQIDALKSCLTDPQKEQYNQYVTDSQKIFWEDLANLASPDIEKISEIFDQMLL